MNQIENINAALDNEFKMRGLSETADILWIDLQKLARERHLPDSSSRDGFMGLHGPVPHE